MRDKKIERVREEENRQVEIEIKPNNNEKT